MESGAVEREPKLSATTPPRPTLRDGAAILPFGPKQLPHIHQLVLDAAEVLDIPPPQLYIRWGCTSTS